ncbi:MAG TPA: hypothetical protein VFW46_09275 [Stellaceae bacterium]|nr:hypothetical protein [Stellaceae bacterium]
MHETVQWRFAHYTDCFSLVRKPLPEDNGAPPKIFANDVFPAEIKLSELLGESWGAALAG